MGQVQMGKMIGWGVGPEGTANSLARIFEIGPEDIAQFRAAGLTQDLAQAWADFYANEALRVPGNPSALGRFYLMRFIAYLLGQ
jgi:hypothetical protein